MGASCSSAPPPVQERLSASLSDAVSPIHRRRSFGMRRLALLTTEDEASRRQMVETDEILKTLIQAADAGESSTIKAYGLIGLANLLRADENQIRLFETEGVLEAMLRAAKDGETAEIRLYGLRGLVNFTFSPDNRVRIFNVCGAVEAMLVAAQSKNKRSLKYGMLGLSNLAIAPENRVRLFQMNGVLDAMLRAMLTVKSSEVRRLGLMGLANLALADENAVTLFETKGVVEAMLVAARDPEIKYYGLTGLCNLTFATENQVRLRKTKGIIRTLLGASRVGNPPATRLLGLAGLANLAHAEKNKVYLLETDGVAESMLVAAWEGETSALKVQGLRGLVNLATMVVNKVRLLETSIVVEAFVSAALNGETNDIQVYGLLGLASFVYSAKSAVCLFGYKGVVEAFVGAIQHGTTCEMKRHGISGLANLAIVEENKCHMCFDKEGVIETLILCAQDGEGEIPAASFKLLETFSESIPVAESLVMKHDILSLLKGKVFKEDVSIFLNLAMAPRAREILRNDPEIINCIEEICSSSPACVLALAILRGSDPIASELMGVSALKIVWEVLQAAMEDKAVLGRSWRLQQPLLALRYLATLESNRRILGTEWLSSLPLVVEKGVTMDRSCVGEYTFECLSQYALDPSLIEKVRTNSSILEAADQLLRTKGGVADWSKAIASVSLFMCIIQGDDETEEILLRPRQVVISHISDGPNDVASQIQAFLEGCGHQVARDSEDLTLEIKGSTTVIVLLSKAYMESARHHREISTALRYKKLLVPLLVEAGYNHCVDGWLGECIGCLPFYDVSSSSKRDSVLRTVGQAVFGMESLQSRVKMLPSKGITCEQDMRRWARGVGLHQETIDALCEGGFVDDDLLGTLAGEPASELLKLLNLSLPAHGAKLRAELRKLYS